MPELPEVETVRRGLAPVMEGARFNKVEARRGDLRWPCRKDFARAAARPRRRAARAARQISARRSRRRRRAGHASRHVRLVPRDRGGRRSRRPGSYHHARSKLRAHDHVVFHMSSGARCHLQRSAPLRHHGARAARRARPGAAAARDRASSRSARSSMRRCSPPVRGQDGAAEGGAARSAAGRRPRQHLCLRGAASGAAVARAARRAARDAAGTPNERAGAPRRGDPRGAATPRSRPAARRCATTAAPTARSAISSTISASMTARASPARARLPRASSGASCNPAARPSTARSARGERRASSALQSFEHVSRDRGKHEHRDHPRRDPRPGRPDHAQPAARR